MLLSGFGLVHVVLEDVGIVELCTCLCIHVNAMLLRVIHVIASSIITLKGFVSLVR